MPQDIASKMECNKGISAISHDTGRSLGKICGGAGAPRGGRADCGCGGGRRAGAHCCSLQATAESLFLFLLLMYQPPYIFFLDPPLHTIESMANAGFVEEMMREQSVLEATCGDLFDHIDDLLDLFKESAADGLLLDALGLTRL